MNWSGHSRTQHHAGDSAGFPLHPDQPDSHHASATNSACVFSLQRPGGKAAPSGHFFEDDGFRFIGLREEPLENPLNRFLQTRDRYRHRHSGDGHHFPNTHGLIVWLAQRLQSPGPLFHVQERAGMQNRRFPIYKFRTMHPDNDDVARQAERRR